MATTRGELGDLRSDLPADVLDAVERYGLAAYVVAAPALVRKLSTGRQAPGQPECPQGVAVVYAAIDWARCGRTDQIASDVLLRPWASYLPPGATTNDAFAVALAWALKPVAGTIALLHGSGSYEAFDYIVRFVRERPVVESPHDASWEAAIDTAADAQALAGSFSSWDVETPGAAAVEPFRAWFLLSTCRW